MSTEYVQVESSWIYSQTSGNFSSRNAGFIFGLGLQGQLRNLGKIHAHYYLSNRHLSTTVGLLLGIFLSCCFIFQIGCGFTEFNKEQGIVRIFRLGFPGKNRYIDYTYRLESIQSICVKISSNILSSSQRGVYMRVKIAENQTRDIPLDLFHETFSLEELELQAANLSKFLRVSLSIL